MFLAIIISIVLYSIGLVLARSLSPEWLYYIGWITGAISTAIFFRFAQGIIAKKGSPQDAEG